MPSAGWHATNQAVQALWRFDGVFAASSGGRSPHQLQLDVDLRRQCLHLRHIGQLLRVPLSSVALSLHRVGLGHLRNLKHKPSDQRYECERPGEQIHISIKSLARFHNSMRQCCLMFKMITLVYNGTPLRRQA